MIVVAFFPFRGLGLETDAQPRMHLIEICKMTDAIAAALSFFIFGCLGLFLGAGFAGFFLKV
jgi:hypothetical protein